MKRTLAALAILSLASVSAVAVAPAFAKSEASAEASTQSGDRGEMKRGPHGGKHAGKHEGRGQMRGHGPHGPRGERMQMWLAQNLNAAETLIGIRADQHDAWRDYTNALLAMFQPPARPAPPAAGAAPEAKPAPQAFAREERLVQRATERAAKAAELSKAIDALKAKLTPEQLEKLAQADLRFGPPMGPRGHGRDRGPGHGPERGQQEQGQQDNGPQDGAAAPDDGDAPQAE
ncbi:hypothetical protein [Kaistia terrae]|uniref:LTXXQ motif family protein n=1 Tax=Kaistia terrae TaxID=537017 RepID=A0ABW0PWN3_9HYPH|nr:hypothetical protein [Kaistia terrae]MCX5580606.1 hypothetical protein [Kaistia terrae]